MTSLEKAARAGAKAEWRYSDNNFDTKWRLDPKFRADSYSAARAVLLAVRDDALSIAEEAFGPAGGGREADDFRQAIDQILQEKGDG
jgi:hypothetical protein